MSKYLLDFEGPLREIEDKIDSMKSTGIKTHLKLDLKVKTFTLSIVMFHPRTILITPDIINTAAPVIGAGGLLQIPIYFFAKIKQKAGNYLEANQIFQALLKSNNDSFDLY